MDQTNIVPIGTDPTESLEIPWMQMEKEPEEWFRRFVTYYLMAGPSRTLLRAMMACVEAEDPQRFENFKLNPPKSARTNWVEMATAWQWRLRALAYDDAMQRDSMRLMDEARTKLSSLSLKAVDALEKSLEESRHRVTAAKEVLDRTGFPATVVRENHDVPFTADDYANASKELESWRQQLKPSIDEKS